MRPYIAVIKDSFREAFASRVLWILLILTTLLLLGLAPLTFKERKWSEFRVNSFLDLTGFVSKIRAQEAADEPSPGKRVWALINQDLQQRLSDFSPERSGAELPGDLTALVVAELNRLLGERGLFDEASWRDIELGKEAGGLLGRGIAKLPGDEVARLNRLLLDAAYPNEIAPSMRSDMVFAYFGKAIGEPQSMAKDQMIFLVKSILAVFMNIFVGAIAVFVAILVTAPIIPQTFEAGAIDLLLSKPVSRSLLFLAKFFGGCAFIVLNAGYLIGGIWLITGLRFGLWSGKLLLCIPLFMFLFAIYYAVSALAGIIWRNAVVSIVVTILFWAACFLVGTTKNGIEQAVLEPGRIVKLVPAGESLLGVTQDARIVEWRSAANKWEPVFLADNDGSPRGPFEIPPLITGPVYDPNSGRVLAIKTPRSAGFRLTASDARLLVGSQADSWAGTAGTAPPRESISLFINAVGETIVVARHGIFRLQGDPVGKPREFSLLGFKVPLGGARSKFVAVGPEQSVRLTAPFAAAMSADSGTLAIWSRGSIHVLQRDEAGKYVNFAEKEFVGESKAAVLAIGGSTILLATADGSIRILDADNLDVREEFRPEGSNQPRFAEASPEGRWFAVAFHNRKLWVFDAENRQVAKFALLGQGDISAAALTGANRLLLADRVARVTEYSLDPFRLIERRMPEMGLLERVYRYAIVPFYTIFPKPRELGNVVAYLLTDQETVPFGANDESLEEARPKLNIREPFWNSLVFLVVVLALTCLHVRRADF